MSGFENYPRETKALELELERLGIAMDIDWSDQAQVRALAREALSAEAAHTLAAAAKGERPALAKAELFGLAALMLKAMTEGANEGIATRGGPAWQSFGAALGAEFEIQRQK